MRRNSIETTAKEEMVVETRNGGDRDKAISDSSKSIDFQQIQDEMELTKHNYEKLAQSDRTTKAKLESVDTKLEALEKQMSNITDVLNGASYSIQSPSR